MRSDDLAPLLGPGDRPEVGFRQGLLTAWNTSTGANTVQVAGQTFTDLPVLATGSLAVAPGDVIALLRIGSTYFIVGALRNAGTGTLSTRVAFLAPLESTTSTTFTDLATVGPTLTDVYIGRSRQCLVFIGAQMQGTNDGATMNFIVSGASTISPIVQASAYFQLGAAGDSFGGSFSTFILLTAGEGLNEGLNTFTATYKSNLGSQVFFSDRKIAVIPF